MRLIKIILTVFFLFVSILFAGTYDLFCDAFSPDLPDTGRIDRTLVDYSVSHQELYRATLHDTLLSRYTIRSQALAFNYPFDDFTINASWQRQILDLDDMFNGDYTEADFRPVANTFQLRSDLPIKMWTIRPAITFSFSSIADTLFITDFPRSDQNAMNNYFFDLLPETFGDSIHFRNNYYSIKGDLLANNKTMIFYLSYRYRSNRLTEAHVNTSTNMKLQGPRESICSLDNMDVSVKFGWHVRPDHMLWAGANYRTLPIDWHHTVYPGDPIPSEIIQLAEGKSYSFQAQLGYKAQIGKYHLHSTLSGGFVNTADTASTPVLGYFLNVFPISHQANLNAGTAYMMARLHADYDWTIKRSTLRPYVDVLASRFWSNIDFKALLEFGLEDIQINENYIHVAYLTALGCDAAIALNQDLYLTLKIEQMIPYVKMISPEAPPKPPSDIKRYGGLSISAGVYLTW